MVIFIKVPVKFNEAQWTSKNLLSKFIELEILHISVNDFLKLYTFSWLS